MAVSDRGPSRLFDQTLFGTAEQAVDFIGNILESSTEYSIIAKDLDGTILVWNEGARRLYGYEPEEVVGKVNASVLHTPEDVAAGRPGQMLEATLLNGRWEGTIARRRKNGSQFMARVVVTPRRDGAGTPVGFLLISRNISNVEEERERLFNLSIDMLCVAGFDGFLKQINPAWTKTLGWTEQEMLDTPFLDLVHPDDRERTVSVLSTLAESRPVFGFENRYRCADGTYRWLSWNSFSLPERDTIFAITRDVTEQRQAGQRLEESERRFREMLDNLELVAVMLDCDASITYCNDYFLRLTGWQRTDVIGKDWSQLFTVPEMTSTFRETFSSMLTHSQEVLGHRMNEIVTRSGERRLIRWNNSVLRSISGEVTGAASIGEDITSRTLAERELRSSEEQLRFIVRASNDGIWERDIKTGEMDFSDRAFSMLGYTRETFHPTLETLFAIVHPDDAGTFMNALTSQFEKEDPYQIRLRVRHANGSYLPFLARGQLQPETGRVLGVFTDLSIVERTEETLREQAVLLADAQRIGRMGSWSMDLHTGRLVWSEATCALFGVTPAEFEGTFEYFRSFILTEDLPSYDAASDRGSPSQPLFEAEYRIRRPDGQVRWMYSRGDFAFDAEGIATSRVGMVMDITEQKAAREQLEQNAALLRIAGKAARLGGWTIELPGHKLTWSDENCIIHDVLPGQTPSLDEGINYYLPEHRALVSRHVEECEQNGTPYDFELPMITATGRQIWARSMGEAVRDAEGRIIRLQGAFQDISDRKKAELLLQESEERYRLMFDRNPHSTWVYDLETLRFLAVNEAAVRHYGYTRDEFLSMGLEDIRPPQQVAEMLRVVRDEGESATPRVYGVFQHRKKDGTLIDVEIASSEITFAGCPAGLVLANDVTERRLIEQQLLRAQRMESLGTLAGGIAHDLNNLLLPIRMGVTLLKYLEPSEPSLRAINNIERSVTRGTDLVKQVLLFARGVEGARTAVDVAEVVAEVSAIIESTFPKNITFAFNISRTLSTVLGDATQLNQVLLNLCVNARDALPNGGQIAISAIDSEIDRHYAETHGGTAAGQYVVLEVADNGSGMTKEVIDRIFEPFFTTKDLGKGTGLGLATVQGIVRSHGGFIDIISEVGKGSTFRVCLPAHSEPVTVSTSEAEIERQPRGNGELILVVDDEASILDITRQTLEKFGYSVLTAEHGAQAIEIYARDQAGIAAVVTDMMMPVMGGAALIEALRQLNPDLPIIAVSGQTDPEQTARITEAGAITSLAKPYSAEVMLQAVFEALGGATAAAEGGDEE